MVNKNLEIVLAPLYNNMQSVTKLGEVANITPGYYPMHSKVFTLKDCHREVKERLIKGYSDALQSYVTIERDAVRAMLTPSKVRDFIFADYQMYDTCLLTADHKSKDFTSRYEYAAHYLHSCVDAGVDGTILWRDPLIRPHLREAMDKKKVIVSTVGNICHAMLDAEANVLSSLGSYLITFPNRDFRTYAAYMAIFNSRIFSFLLYHEMLRREKHGGGRLDVMVDLLIPYETSDYFVLENLSDCFMYLSQPNLHQLTSRITNDRIKYYLYKILDMVVYEMYFPAYMNERNLGVIEYVQSAPFMRNYMDTEERILQTYSWFQRPDNILRQKMDLLDTRSFELLYRIQTFDPNEQD